MLAILKIPLLKPVMAVTLAAYAVVLAMQPTVEVALIGLAGNLIVVVLGLLLKSKLSEIHIMINSRFTQLLDEKGKASFAEGRREGTESAQATQAVKDQGIAEWKKERT